MNEARYGKIFAGAATAFFAASVLLVGLALLYGAASRTGWLLGVGLLAGMVGTAAAWMLWRTLSHQEAAVRYLNSLTDPNGEEIFTEESLAKLPPLNRKSLLSPPLEKLTEALRQAGRRLQELENLRTGLEIRLRRAQTDYQQINMIFTGINDPVLVVNAYGELLLANPSAEIFLDKEAKKNSRSAAQLISCPKLVELLQNMAQRKTPTTRSEEIPWTDPQGRERYYRAAATKLASDAEHPDPTIASVVVVLRDIADQKASQKRYAEFVSSVSHEMKTPLAGIKAYVELLADGDVEDRETQEEFLRMISTQVERLQRLVENLLNLARIEAGVVQVHKQPHSLNEILEEALRVIQPAAESKQIALQTDLSPLYLNVYVDRDLLLQAAINLLSNAVKYTPEGGRVTLRSRLEDEYARFEVEDTGVGLSEEDCQRVFEKFYRVQKDAQMASGTGLGLPLAKHIVEDVHGGSLTVQSTLGQGSTFRVRLPLLARNREAVGLPPVDSTELAQTSATP